MKYLLVLSLFLTACSPAALFIGTTYMFKYFTSTEISYNKDVLPILKNRCSICHNSGVPERNWLDYNTAFKKRAAFKKRLEDKTMPPSGFTLLDNERQLMIDWVGQGAKK